MFDLAAVQIRPAAPEDVPQLTALVEPFVAEQSLLARSEDEIAHLALNGFVAVLEERIIGFSGLEVYSKKLAEVQCLAVIKEFQGRGIGKQLVTRCVQRARQLGVLEIMAITSSDDLFRTCGFHYALPNEKRALFFHPNEDELRT